MTNQTVPNTKLNDGTTIPQLGFGVWQVADDAAQAAVETAFEVGYRHIDTAAIYGNEEGVGRAIAASGLDRDDLYITTKLWNADQGYDSTFSAYATSLDKLGLETVDLYLIHWAAPKFDLYAESWKALVNLHEEGRVRAIGVSNHHRPHLERIIAETGVTPTINQIEMHPYLTQEEMRATNAEFGIVTEAWSPLGSGKGLLEDPVLAEISATHNVTPAQVVIAWHLALGNVVIPKSVTPSRIAENFAALDVSISADEIAAISSLNQNLRMGSNPDEAEMGKPAHL